MLDATENVTSKNRGLRTKKPCLAAYEQTKKIFSQFYPEQEVESVLRKTLTLPMQVYTQSI